MKAPIRVRRGQLERAIILSGLTQRECARRLGVSTSTLNGVLRGRRPGLRLIARLCQVLELDARDILRVA